MSSSGLHVFVALSFVGRNNGYRHSVTTFEEWDKNDAPYVLSSETSETDSEVEDNDLEKSDKGEIC